MGVLDPLRRAVGIATEAELTEARAMRARMESSDRPRDEFAVAVADRAAALGKGGASRVLHEISEGEWPADPDLRWAAAAGAAGGLADRMRTTPLANLDGGLTTATVDRALRDSAVRISTTPTAKDAGSVLDGEIAVTRARVLVLMSNGKAAEHNAGVVAASLEQYPDPSSESRLRQDVSEFLPAGGSGPSWRLEATRTRLAMAQSGLLSPERTVDAAVEMATTTGLTEGPLAPYDRAKATSAGHAGRATIMTAMLQRTMTAAYGPGGMPGQEAAPAVQQQLTPEMQREHAALLMKEQLAASRAVDAPVAILTGGQPGSGKSYIVQSVGVQFEGHGGAIKIDPDRIRPTIPYMAERIARGDLDIPDAAYNDAGTIAYQMIQIAKLERRNVIIDGTLQNTERAEGLAIELKQAQYAVAFHGMATNADLSHARTYKRREQEIQESPTGFGRGVGDEFHHQALKGYGTTMESFQRKASVDSMTLHFGGETPPVSTRLVDGRWQPAVSMREKFDAVQERPAPGIMTEAERTWTKALDAMQSRRAPDAEIAKITQLREVTRAKIADPSRAARQHAISKLYDRGMG